MTGLSPSIWGPHAWFFLESICLSYPDDPTNEDINNYRNFFMSLGNILPCHKCRNNYNNHLNIYPITNEVLKNKNNLINWIINMHNLVRKLNNGKMITYDEFVDYYISKYDKSSFKLDSKIYITILFVFLFVVIYLLYKWKN